MNQSEVLDGKVCRSVGSRWGAKGRLERGPFPAGAIHVLITILMWYLEVLGGSDSPFNQEARGRVLPLVARQRALPFSNCHVHSPHGFPFREHPGLFPASGLLVYCSFSGSALTPSSAPG